MMVFLKKTIKDKTPLVFRALYNIKHFRAFFLRKKYAKSFETNSVEVFRHFHEGMVEAGCTYWLTFGTLLGAIREKHFIKNDNDIDVGVMDDFNNELVHKSLIRNGFKRCRNFEIYTKNGIEEKGGELTYEKQGVFIDIFIFHKDINRNAYIYTHDARPPGFCTKDIHFYSVVRRIYLPFDGLVSYKFLNTEVNIPINYTTYLSAHYGEDYMISNPNWSTDNSPVAYKVPGAVYVSIEE